MNVETITRSKRVKAGLLDALMVNIFSSIISATIFFATGQVDIESSVIIDMTANNNLLITQGSIIFVVIVYYYLIPLSNNNRATLMKKAFNLKIVTVDNNTLSAGAYFRRSIVPILFITSALVDMGRFISNPIVFSLDPEVLKTIEYSTIDTVLSFTSTGIGIFQLIILIGIFRLTTFQSRFDVNVNSKVILVNYDEQEQVNNLDTDTYEITDKDY